MSKTVIIGTLIWSSQVPYFYLGKVQNLGDGGGRHLPQIVISPANDLIYANDFIRVPLFSLRIPKNSKSKIIRPP